jgi:hypothetical protein
MLIIQPLPSNDTNCGATWKAGISYVYQGAKTESVFLERIGNLTNGTKHDSQTMDTYERWADFMKKKPLDPLYTKNYLIPTKDNIGGIPSVLVNRSMIESGKFLKYTIKELE